MNEWVKRPDPIEEYKNTMKVNRASLGSKRGRKDLVKGVAMENAVKITPDLAKVYAARRYEKAREASAKAMAKMVEEINRRMDATGKMPNLAKLPEEAWGDVVGHAVDIYFRSGSPKGLSDLGGFIGKATGMLRQDGEKEQENGNLPITGIEEAKRVINMFFVMNKEDIGEVIDAEAYDG